MAGRSLRALRSPVAPKMTMSEGSRTLKSSNPSASGLWSSAFAPVTSSPLCGEVGSARKAGAAGRGPRSSLLFCNHRMPAELVPHHREHLVGERVLHPAAETGEQRLSDDRRGHRLLDRGLHRPPPLARVLDVTLD